MSAQPTIYLVTGGGRGIGFSLVQALSTRPNTVVYAGVRSFPPGADSDLGRLAAQSPTVVLPIKLTSGSIEDNHAAAAAIKGKFGMLHCVIACAGVSSGLSSVLSATPSQMRSDFETNSISPLVLFQALAPLLLATHAASPGSASPKFVAISSQRGQITDCMAYTFDSYGCSKAALNYLIKKMDVEHPQIISFPIHPGSVKTEMGHAGVAALSVKLEDIGGISAEESAAGILSVIDKATKESQGGRFCTWEGEQLPF